MKPKRSDIIFYQRMYLYKCTYKVILPLNIPRFISYLKHDMIPLIVLSIITNKAVLYVRVMPLRYSLRMSP